MRSPVRAPSLFRHTRRPCLSTLVGLVLVAAAGWLAWTASQQDTLLETATASTPFR